MKNLHSHSYSPGLYIHIPFCASRCAYCAFVSSFYSESMADRYLDALSHELKLRGLEKGRFFPSTLFIGGGTPSKLSLGQIERLMDMLPFPVAGGEASIEMNPESVDGEKLSLLRDRGITRCSLGVQTFSEAGLVLLGRIHHKNQALEALRLLRTIGFDSLNIDLITAWPTQSEEDLLVDLKTAIDAGVNHLSCYNLIVEEDAAFFGIMRKKGLAEMDEATALGYWAKTESMVVRAGFEHYEVSNFARPGHRCRHNVNTWKGKDYYGVGAAAHSHIGGSRFANTERIDTYIETLSSAEMCYGAMERLNPAEKARECAVFWLRLAEGIDVVLFREQTGFDVAELYAAELPFLIESGILELYKLNGREMLRVRPEKYAILDAVLVDLV